MSASGSESKRTNSRSGGSICDCANFAQILADMKKKLDACHKLIKNQNTKIVELTETVSQLNWKIDDKVLPFRKTIGTENTVNYTSVVKRIQHIKEHALLVKPVNVIDGNT